MTKLRLTHELMRCCGDIAECGPTQQQVTIKDIWSFGV